MISKISTPKIKKQAGVYPRLLFLLSDIFNIIPIFFILIVT
jgi:hypothetical protein